MFYRPENGHGLPHNPFNALIVPRPIAWITTRDADGHANLAPYSFFNGVAYEPPQVMFATTSGKEDRGLGKDSLDNIRQTGVFCVHMVSEDLTDAMNISASGYARDVNEIEKAGLEWVECDTINAPRLTAAPAALECKLTQITQLPGEANHVCFGQVTGIHLRDDCLVDGVFDITRARPLARLGYRDYCVVQDRFELKRPGE
ncbi:flavin reductase family protein [Aliiroseovarius halocynthiae]|uniref:Flavin reductase family protein n=1 Tax=Aliiroseovarius halocynthiae TaxID=985055 RepID=A0A545SR04_9RHOB|nr:flavin reductase family protein [Aliiroseovarius halocynthiae]TQV67389.1 flavin reductase family protein [Aliiroseovarius halocynthiae]